MHHMITLYVEVMLQQGGRTSPRELHNALKGCFKIFHVSE